jgi:hypothetical protein
MRIPYCAATALLLASWCCRAEETSGDLETVLGDNHEHNGSVFNNTHHVNENTTTAVTHPTKEPDLVRMISYDPSSQVTDHAALDLDQQSMVQIMRTRGADRQQLLVQARQIYQKGGHSGSYALLSVKISHAMNISMLTQVVSMGANGLTPVRGFIPRDLSFKGTEGTVQIPVEYETSNDQANYVKCQVGGLVAAEEAVKGGCKLHENHYIT